MSDQFTFHTYFKPFEPFATTIEQFEDLNSSVLESFENPLSSSRDIIIGNNSNSFHSNEYRLVPIIDTKRVNLYERDKRKSPKKPSQRNSEDDNNSNKKNGLEKENKRRNNKRKKQEKQKEEVVHVRVKRGEATDTHSLAERVRREKINNKLKCLKDLVPGCQKTMGLVTMLDEIIGYVHSLKNQVEFLTMELESACSNPSSRDQRAIKTAQETDSHNVDKWMREQY